MPHRRKQKSTARSARQDERRTGRLPEHRRPSRLTRKFCWNTQKIADNRPFLEDTDTEEWRMIGTNRSAHRMGVLFCLLLVFSTAATAQAVFGNITGVVTDPS